MCGITTAVNVFPFFFTMFIPIYGLIFGPEGIIIPFILISLYTVASHWLKPIEAYSTFLSAIVHAGLIAVVFSTPMSWCPASVTACYELLIRIAEPFWLFCEMVAVYHIITELSELIIMGYEKMEVYMKTLLLSLSMLAYGVTGVLIVSLYSCTPNWLLLLVFLISLGSHYIMYHKEQGNILDVALLLLCSYAVLYVMRLEVADYDQSRETIRSWNKARADLMQSSLAKLSWTILVNGLEYLRAAIFLWRQIIALPLVVSVVLRAIFIWLFIKWHSQSDDGDEDSVITEEGYGSMNALMDSDTFYRLCLYALLAHTARQHFQWTSISWAKDFRDWFPYVDLVPGRVFQALVIQFIYIYDLHSSVADQ